MAIERYPIGKREFMSRVMYAAKLGDATLFSSLVGTSKAQKLTARELGELFQYTDELGNSLFHYLLTDTPSWFRIKKRRRDKAKILDTCLALWPESKQFDEEAYNHEDHPFNKKNNSGNTPFHLAIAQGNTSVVSKMLKLGADIAVNTIANQSTLELAVRHKKYPIYKMLLKGHGESNNKTMRPQGYTDKQITQAHTRYMRSLRFKQITMGIFGSIMTIACPIGAILAFYELPLLEILFSALIPGVGPFIGLGGAVIIGGLLFWSMYHKASVKYGHHAQEMETINSINARLDRLEAELRDISDRLSKDNLSRVSKDTLLSQQLAVLEKLDQLYSTVEVIDTDNLRVEHSTVDWATPADLLRTKMLTFGSFLCAFSGILGILGGISTYLPAAVTATAIFAGIPVAGWCALGVAIAVGLCVAVWAYHAKYKPALEECGENRRKMYERKVALSQRRARYEETRHNFQVNQPSESHKSSDYMLELKKEKVEEKQQGRIASPIHSSVTLLSTMRRSLSCSALVSKMGFHNNECGNRELLSEENSIIEVKDNGLGRRSKYG